MEQPDPPQSEPHDVLSVGEGRVPRWARLGVVLVVLMVGMAAYRLVSGPSDPAAPEPAEAAQEPVTAFVTGGRSAQGTDGTRRGAVVRLRGDLVPLRGPEVRRPEREASAIVLGRLGPGWLVQLTSTACHDKADVQT